MKFKTTGQAVAGKSEYNVMGHSALFNKDSHSITKTSANDNSLHHRILASRQKRRTFFQRIHIFSMFRLAILHSSLLVTRPHERMASKSL